jgi:hypothetical protein
MRERGDSGEAATDGGCANKVRMGIRTRVHTAPEAPHVASIGRARQSAKLGGLKIELENFGDAASGVQQLQNPVHDGTVSATLARHCRAPAGR